MGADPREASLDLADYGHWAGCCSCCWAFKSRDMGYDGKGQVEFDGGAVKYMYAKTYKSSECGNLELQIKT